METPLCWSRCSVYFFDYTGTWVHPVTVRSDSNPHDPRSRERKELWGDETEIHQLEIVNFCRVTGNLGSDSN